MTDQITLENAVVENMQTAMDELRKTAPSKATVNFSIGRDGVYVHFRPLGWGLNEPSIVGSGGTFRECLNDATEKWQVMCENINAQMTNDIALAIIRITHELGACTNAALRAEFSVADIDQFGSQAVLLANEMGERGPFSIEPAAAANAA